MRNEIAVQQAVEIFAGFTSNMFINVNEIMKYRDAMLNDLYQSVINIGVNPTQTPNPNYPSDTDDYLICKEDGKKLKMMKRYLQKNYNMSIEEYRQKWGLPATFTGVAPSYSRARSAMAKDIGLGKK